MVHMPLLDAGRPAGQIPVGLGQNSDSDLVNASESGHADFQNKSEISVAGFLVGEPAVVETGLSSLLPAYYDAVRLRASERGARDCLTIIRGFFGWIGQGRACAATVEAYLSWRRDAGASPKTAQNYLMALRAFGKWLVVRDVETRNFTEGVAIPKVPRRAPRFLNHEQVRQALALAVQNGVGAEVAVAIYSGLRLSELRRLRWQDIDFAAKSIVVEDTKGNRIKAVPLHPLAAQALQARRDADGRYDWVFAGARRKQVGKVGGWNPNRPRRMNTWFRILKPLQDAMPIFRQAPKGSVTRGWHLFRHTFASLLVQAGVNIKKVSVWMGHSSVVTTEKYYAHLAPGYDEDIERM
jgi:integrase